MSNRHNALGADQSRRTVIRRFALTVGGTALVGAGLAERRAIAADSKLAQAAVGYQDSPQGAQNCGNCEQFVVPASCKVVAGNISPGSWCKIYAKKSA